MSHSQNITDSTVSRKLHVVLHGLIGARVSQDHQSIELHVPEVKAHTYRAGSFSDLGAFIEGHDYFLDGVHKEKFCPNLDAKQFIVIGLKEQGLSFQPRGTHATVRLPWPKSINTVRPLIDGESSNPLFKNPKSINPRSLGYISYLTYELADGDRPTLYKGADRFWFTGALEAHNRLHFFADPAHKMEVRELAPHFSHAYGALSNQLLGRKLQLEPNVDENSRWKFADKANSDDIPDSEAVDLVELLNVMDLDRIGNCDCVWVIDGSARS